MSDKSKIKTIKFLESKLAESEQREMELEAKCEKFKKKFNLLLKAIRMDLNDDRVLTREVHFKKALDMAGEAHD